MTPREIAAYNAGIEAVRQMALIAAVTLETRDDAKEVRQRAAAAALQGLSEGAKALVLQAPAACSAPDVNRVAEDTANLLPPPNTL